MIGKVLKVNDYKFEYGKETTYINAFGGFKYKKNGNKYIVYSYDNNKLFYGSLFIKNIAIIIMDTIEDASSIIKEFVDNILDNKINDNFEVISLNKAETVQIIDEAECTFVVDVYKLKEMTIPKPKSLVNEEVKPEKKRVSVVGIGLFLVFVVAVIFFAVNPQIITGENKNYSCVKNYEHNKLPADVTEKIELVFTNKNKIVSINIIADYKFRDSNYYTEFKDKNYFYQYFHDGDTYKFEDDNKIFRLFSEVDTEVDYFMPEDLNDLIKYYKDNGYNCVQKEEEK